MSCLYILEVNPSSVALFANIFSHSEGRLLILFMVSHSSVGKESACNAGDPGSLPGSGRSAGEGIDRLPTPVFLGFLCGSAGKESTCNMGLIPGLGRSPGEEKGYPLQYSGLENSTVCIVNGVAKSRTQRATFTFTFLCKSFYI